MLFIERNFEFATSLTTELNANPEPISPNKMQAEATGSRSSSQRQNHDILLNVQEVRLNVFYQWCLFLYWSENDLVWNLHNNAAMKVK